MRKFTDEQLEELRLILQDEFKKDFSIENASLAANSLFELFDLLRRSSFNPKN